jgi:hypothetical protein
VLLFSVFADGTAVLNDCGIRVALSRVLRNSAAELGNADRIGIHAMFIVER